MTDRVAPGLGIYLSPESTRSWELPCPGYADAICPLPRTSRRTRVCWSRAVPRGRVLRVGRSLRSGTATAWLQRGMNLLLALVAIIATAAGHPAGGGAGEADLAGPGASTSRSASGSTAGCPAPRPTTTAATATSAARPFTIYKFRTMRVDAERQSGAVWAQQHDPRVTPVGRLLRQYRLDELPQLLNVLKGEMNIVGPRPERPTIFAELREPHRRVPAAPAGQAGHHRAGPDQPPLRPLARRRAHQGALRPGVHPPPERARRPPHHAQDRPRHPPPPRRLVRSRPRPPPRCCAGQQHPCATRMRRWSADPAPSALVCSRKLTTT